MNNLRWIRIAAVEQLPLREGRAVQIGDREIAIFNLGDHVLAMDNECPHQGGPLCDGIVTGRSVVCPLHGWKANIETGAIERPRHALDHCVETYPVQVIDGIVVVGIGSHSPVGPDRGITPPWGSSPDRMTAARTHGEAGPRGAEARHRPES